MKKKEGAEILAISDVHLGSEDCKAEKLLMTLKKHCFGKLVIVGDLSENKKPVTKEQFGLVKYLYNHREKIVYVDGNHDPSEENAGEIIGVEPVKEYTWEINKKRFCAIHGHQFDEIISSASAKTLEGTFRKMMVVLKKVELFGQNLGKNFISFCDRFIAPMVTQGAKKYALKHGHDTIICGHTHRPFFRVFWRKNGRKIHYYNCGSWVDDICTFLTVDKNGKTKLHRAT